MPYSVSPFLTACDRLPLEEEDFFFELVVSFGFVLERLELELLRDDVP